MLLYTSGKSKLFAKNFSNNSNLDNPDISLPIFPSRTKTPAVVLKNWEPEVLYKLVELFNMCLVLEFCIPECCKVSPIVQVFKNAVKSSTNRSYCPASLLSLVSKVFEKVVNNSVDLLEK